jgi:hydroxyethylthiazole kinase-like uncharacterized protein yjeF
MGMPVVTPDEMRAIDRIAIEDFGIPGHVLMENAGRGTFRVIEELVGPVVGLRALVICGRGNNGGDGFVVARYLESRGADVTVYLLAEKRDVSGDARTYMEVAERLDIDIVELTDEGQLGLIEVELEDADIVVDAIFGTGFKGDVEGIPGAVIELINDSDAAVIAIDIPSGVSGADGSAARASVFADATATMCLPKAGLVLYPGRAQCGEIWLVDIGTPPSALDEREIRTHLVDDYDVLSLLPWTPPDAHKGTCGRVLVIAGSRGMTGAAALTSMAALRAGAGLVTLAVPETLNSILEEKVTEVITRPLPDTGSGTFAASALGEIRSLLEEVDALALGPGISTHPETAALVRSLVENVSLPTVIDADGINNLAGSIDLIKGRTGLVITPHPGELARLLGTTIPEIQRDRIAAARSTAERLGVALLLKGAPTVVAIPTGEAWINTTGNPGLASGGTGDVLTGILAGLLARGLAPHEAAMMAAYLHGLAADLVIAETSEESLIAGDVLDALPDAFAYFHWLLEGEDEEEEEEEHGMERHSTWVYPLLV